MALYCDRVVGRVVPCLRDRESPPPPTVGGCFLPPGLPPVLAALERSSVALRPACGGGERLDGASRLQVASPSSLAPLARGGQGGAFPFLSPVRPNPIEGLARTPHYPLLYWCVRFDGRRDAGQPCRCAPRHDRVPARASPTTQGLKAPALRQAQPLRAVSKVNFGMNSLRELHPNLHFVHLPTNRTHRTDSRGV